MNNLQAINKYTSKGRKEKGVDWWGVSPDVGIALYDFVVNNNIKKVVETGLWKGISSAYFLEALKKTEGCLYSIDRTVGETYADEQKHANWRILEGHSLALLDEVLPDTDLFWHDSCHLYSYQLAEYEKAIKHARYIGSHDVHKTKAWDDFVEKHKLEELERAKKYAIARGRNG